MRTRSIAGSSMFVGSSMLLLVSCGGGAAEPTSAEQGGSGGEAAAAAPSWAQMDHAQRARFMAEVVVPEMRAIFQEVDAQRFADFGCPTCHGANAQEVSFAMPNGIAPLDRSNMQQYFESTEPIAVAMRERVWPRMGQLLGEPLYNPETHTGFSCFDCHGVQGAEAREP